MGVGVGGKYSTGTGAPEPEPAVYILLVLLKFQNVALKPVVYEMGGNFRLQNGLNLA